MDEEKDLNQEINVANDVVATIAGMAVAKVDGVAKMAGGFTEGLKAISGKKQMSRGIKVESDGDNVKIEINIIVRYGVNIREVGKNIQDIVKEEVENMTGNKVERVVVNVQGVKVDDNDDEKVDTTDDTEE